MKSLLFILAAVSAVAHDASKSCDADCQHAFDTAFAAESAKWVNPSVPDDPFYNMPANATNCEPGTLIKWEQLTPDQLVNKWTIPEGLSVARLLYMSSDIDDSPLPASAWALLPTNKTGTLKPLVWTHGTAGRIRNCAPTNHKELYYDAVVFNLALEGYAVIGPDYTGLGTEIKQGFMYEAGYLHAADVAFALLATRQSGIGSRLDRDWAVIGHSEGGLTAWRTAERLAMPGQEALREAGNFVGAVAIAPALRPLDLIPESFRRAAGGPVGAVVHTYFLQSLAGLYPEIKVENYLTDLALARLELSDRACLAVGSAMFDNLTETETFKDISWLKHPLVINWQKRYNGAGPHPLAAPMLVVQGVDDPLTYALATEKDFNLTCEAFPTSRAELLLYPGLNHGSVLQAGPKDYLPWLADRFNHVKTEVGCKKKRM